MRLTSLALAAALALSAGTALAADRAAVQACRADFKKHCAGVKPGDGRGADCLRQHEAELSPGCKAVLGGATRCVERAREVCGGSGSGDARRACLKAHAAELGDCQAPG